MKFKLFLKIFAPVLFIVFVLMTFTGCKEDELSKLFDDGELGDFWDLRKDEAEIVAPPNKSDGDDVIYDDDVLNMDTVKRLAYGDINPFEFMKKFPGVLDGDGPVTYSAFLPNNYAVRIIYSGDVIESVYLDDRELGKYLDLQTQQIEIAEFLLERGN